MNISKPLALAFSLLLCAVLSTTIQADGQTSADSGSLILENKDHGTCRIALTDQVVRKTDERADIPNCAFRYFETFRFENAPSAVTVHFRSFTRIYPDAVVSDCDANQPTHRYRLTIKTMAPITGAGQSINLGRLLQAATNTAVGQHVRLVAKSSNFNPGAAPEVHFACLRIDTGN